MSEETNVPVQPDSTTVDTTSGTTSTTVQQTTVPVNNEGVTDWKKRYDGQQIALQKLSLEKQDLQKQLDAKISEAEQLGAQLSLKDTEKTVAVGERDKQLQEALGKIQMLETENNELKALALKVQIARELKKPELIEIAEAFPNLTDKDMLTQVMKDIAGFSDNQVKARESQLLAGTLPTIVQGDASPAMPATEQEWMDRINSFDFGTPERQKALDQYGDFLNNKYQT